ncbi:MAG: hypothetical protein U0587_20035 [Candidatus Binatia bacterium]
MPRLRYFLVGMVTALSVGADLAHAQRATSEADLRDAIRGYESTIRHQFRGVVSDWTHRHAIVSEPQAGSPASYRARTNPRYWLGRIARLAPTTRELVRGDRMDRGPLRRRPKETTKLTGDWTMRLGPAGSGTVGDGMFPAKFDFYADKYDCTNDFVVFNTSVAGGSGQATIMAFNNLYKGCGGAVPGVYWAYNTNDGAIASTSAVLSLDGTQVAFVQSAGGAAYLVLLKWSSGSGSAWNSPATPTDVSASNYGTCTAPCMHRMSLVADNTNSPPFYDYDNDTIYVGDDNSVLHKISGVFNGTPTEASSPWPITLNGTANLTGPVYDSVSGNVFVADDTGMLYCRTSAGVDCGSVDVNSGSTQTNDIVDPPLVDSASGTVFASTRCTGTLFGFCSGAAQVVQVPAVNMATPTPVRANVGSGSGSNFVRAGAFDNNYYAPPTPGNYSSGHLYVCGNPSALSARRLYRLDFNAAGLMSTSVTTGPIVSNGNSQCSPITEVYNPDGGGAGVARDWIFLSLPQPRRTPGWCPTPPSGVNDGCVMSFNVTTPLPNATATPAAKLAAPGGSSGIIVDNVVLVPAPTPTRGTSQVYFSQLVPPPTTTPGGAVQASQAGLN